MQPVDATNQALHHVQQGRSSSDLRDHTKSFWHFLQALTLVPQLLDVLENEMVVAVKGAAFRWLILDSFDLLGQCHHWLVFCSCCL